LTEKEALLAVEGGIDGVTGIGQRRNQLAIEIAVIFEDQYAHDCLTLFYALRQQSMISFNACESRPLTGPARTLSRIRAPPVGIARVPEQYKGFQGCASMSQPGGHPSPPARPKTRDRAGDRPGMASPWAADGDGWPAAPAPPARPAEAPGLASMQGMRR